MKTSSVTNKYLICYTCFPGRCSSLYLRILVLSFNASSTSSKSDACWKSGYWDKTSTNLPKTMFLHPDIFVLTMVVYSIWAVSNLQSMNLHPIKHTVSDIGIGKITFVETRTPKITSRNFCQKKNQLFWSENRENSNNQNAYFGHYTWLIDFWPSNGNVPH